MIAGLNNVTSYPARDWPAQNDRRRLRLRRSIGNINAITNGQAGGQKTIALDNLFSGCVVTRRQIFRRVAGLDRNQSPAGRGRAVGRGQRRLGR